MEASATYTCTLPGGYVDGDGRCHREVVLRPLTGRDEEVLVANREGAAETITRLLASCVQRIGTVADVTEQVTRHLIVADRQYLLLRLRAATFGEQVKGALGCPWPDCGARVDVDFQIADVPVEPVVSRRRRYGVQLPAEADSSPLRIRFRLPDGSDQEAVAPVLGQNAARALTMLLERCLEPPSDAVPSEFVATLSPRARATIEAAMQEYAPTVDLDMDVTCPECGRSFTAPFDVQDFFLGELGSSRDLLYRQVHYLAYHYHWSEREVLEMSREKRHTYIEILAEEIEALNRTQ